MAGRPKKEIDNQTKTTQTEVQENKTSQIDIKALKEQLKEELKKEMELQFKQETDQVDKENQFYENKFHKIDRNELIEVMNYNTGGLIYVNERTQFEMKWEKFGDTDIIPMGELISMKSSQSKFLFEPWLIILNNNNAIKQLGLNSVMDKIIKVNDINKFFEMTIEEMDEFINELSKKNKRLLSEITYIKVETGELTDLIKINFLASKFNRKLLPEV